MVQKHVCNPQIPPFQYHPRQLYVPGHQMSPHSFLGEERPGTLHPLVNVQCHLESHRREYVRLLCCYF